MDSTTSVKRTMLIAALAIFMGQLFVVYGIVSIQKPDFPKGKPSSSKLGIYGKAAVAANGPECAEIGTKILKKGGSAVDAAIATLLCDGVVSVHSMGIGGGFLMTIWNATSKAAFAIDARETAPAKSNSDMFKTADEARIGGKSIAVPGELMGYWDAHQEFGVLPWEELFKPTIEICKRGSLVNDYIAESLRSVQDLILQEKTMSDILIDPKTNKTWTVGDRIKRPQLAKTLKVLSKGNPRVTFYNGQMGETFVREIQAMGGIMEVADLKNYMTDWYQPLKFDLNGLTLYSVSPPGSGVILGFIMSILKDLLPTTNQAVFYQRLVETFKWAYARRSEFGDPQFENITSLMESLNSTEYIDFVRKSIRDDWTSNDPTYYGAESVSVPDAGTANICVFSEDGSAVTVTSTINQYLGSMRRSVSTGIIFNDEMDDFSSPRFKNGFEMPPSPSNYIRPLKRPMSSMAPSVLIDDKTQSVRMLVGSAGGTKITTAVATTMALHLYAGFDIKQAIDAKRLHHQLFPMTVDYEIGFNEEILDHLRKIGHDVSTHPRMGSTVTAITVERDNDGKLVIKANSDGRREGNVDGY